MTKPPSAREVISRAFTKVSEAEFDDDFFAEIALAALKDAGFEFWRDMTPEEEEENNW